MHNKFRLYRRKGGSYYWHDNDTGKQGALKTTNKREALLLLTAKNESKGAPVISMV